MPGKTCSCHILSICQKWQSLSALTYYIFLKLAGNLLSLKPLLLLAVWLRMASSFCCLWIHKSIQTNITKLSPTLNESSNRRTKITQTAPNPINTKSEGKVSRKPSLGHCLQKDLSCCFPQEVLCSYGGQQFYAVLQVGSWRTKEEDTVWLQGSAEDPVWFLTH